MKWQSRQPKVNLFQIQHQVLHLLTVGPFPSREHKQMSRELFLEKRNNPKYNELYSGKEHLDEEYNQMLNHDKDLNSQMEKQTHKLYSKYRVFKDSVKRRKRKRDRMLRGLLSKASFENHFIGNELPKDIKRTPEVELGPMGISVKDKNEEIKKQKLMGMKDIDDLQGLHIRKQIEHRERMLRMRNKKYFSKREEVARDLETSPRERSLLESPVKMVKRVKSIGSQSFLLRNRNKKNSKGSFKPERGLRQVRHIRKVKTHKTKHRRKLANKPPANKKPADKKTEKKKKLAKKFKKKYIFDWRTLKWKHMKKYKYTLITNLKDLKFWKSMGIRIKKHKLKLFYRWESNRKYKKGQRQCVLTVRFSPMTYFWDLQLFFLKGTFKSNCFKYTVEKLFKAHHAHHRRFKIQFGKFSFETVFHHRIHKYGWYNRQYLTNIVWPMYKSKAFNPWKRPADYVKFGLAPAKALKWKTARFKLFLNYQHHYPHKTRKQAEDTHEKVLRKKWIKVHGNRVPYKPKYGRKDRRLKQVKSPVHVLRKHQKVALKKRKSQIDPMERELRGLPRKLRYRWITRWRDRWEKLYLDGYRNVLTHNGDNIVGSSSSNPKVNYADLLKLWKDTKSVVYCHGSSYRKVCKI